MRRRVIGLASCCASAACAPPYPGFATHPARGCFSAAATRYFTDDYPAERTEIGFHGHYYANGRLNADLVSRYGLRDWIIKYSDGKADPQLVERWINIPYSRGMIHFFDPALLSRDGASTFFCQGDEPTRLVFACEPIDKTALDLGVVTSLEIMHSADQPASRSPSERSIDRRA